jgi:hypothetical protein
VRLAEGETFVGTYLRLARGQTARGLRWIAVFRDEHGAERSLWLLHTVLISQLRKVEPRPGDLLAIRRLGTRTSATGAEYEDYRVSSGRAFSWADVIPADADDTEPF